MQDIKDVEEDLDGLQPLSKEDIEALGLSVTDLEDMGLKWVPEDELEEHGITLGKDGQPIMLGQAKHERKQDISIGTIGESEGDTKSDTSANSKVNKEEEYEYEPIDPVEEDKEFEAEQKRQRDAEEEDAWFSMPDGLIREAKGGFIASMDLSGLDDDLKEDRGEKVEETESLV